MVERKDCFSSGIMVIHFYAFLHILRTKNRTILQIHHPNAIEANSSCRFSFIIHAVPLDGAIVRPDVRGCTEKKKTRSGQSYAQICSYCCSYLKKK